MQWILACLLLFASITAFAAEDPWYKTAPSCSIDRGNPARTGYYNEEPLIKMHKVAWITEAGYPTICYKNLMFLWKGDASGGLVALDINTGHLLWRPMLSYYKLYIYNNLLYVATRNAYSFMAYSPNTKKFIATGPKNYGLGLIYNNIAYLNGPKNIIAYRLNDKKTLWQKNHIAYQLSTDGKNLYFEGFKKLVALDLLSGKTQWTAPYHNKDVIAHYLTVSNGYVFFIDFGDNNKNDTYLYAFNSDTGKLDFKITIPTTFVQPLVSVAHDTLLISTNNTLFAYDLKTKSYKWTLNIGNRFGYVLSASSIAKNIVYIANNKFLYAIDLNTGKILDKLKLPFKDYGDRIYVNQIIPYQNKIFLVVDYSKNSYLITIQ